MNIAHPHPMVQASWPPPHAWRGTWPPPAGAPGVGVPQFYPAPPPMPPGFAYGERAWANGAWVIVPDGRMRSRQPRRDSDYWKTELKENPLGLENMIPAEQLKANAAANADAAKEAADDARSVVWVPALSDDDPRGRVHHRQVSTSSRSSSQPHHDRPDPSPPPPLPIPPLTPMDDFNVLPSGKAAWSTMGRPQSSAGHRLHRPIPSSISRYDQHRPSGRMSVPADSARHNTFRFASEPPPSSGPAQHYPHKRPAIDSDSDTTATATQRPSSRGVPATRSYTIPSENVHRERYASPHQAYAPRNTAAPHRRGSVGAAMPMASTSIQRSRTMPPEIMYPVPSHPRDVHARRSHDRLQDAPYSSQNIYTPSREAQHQYARPQQQQPHYGVGPRMPTPESAPEDLDAEGEAEPIDPKSVDRVRKWLAKNDDINRQTPLIRRTMDSYESPSLDRTRGGYTPGVAIRPLGRQNEVPRASTMPSNMRPYYPIPGVGTADEADALAHRLAGTSMDDDDEYVGPVNSGQRNTLQRQDTIIVDVDAENRNALLPSPKSIPHATSGTNHVAPRRSYERVMGYSGAPQPSPKSFTSNRSSSRGHHVSPASSQHFHGGSMDTGNPFYGSPPITPNKPNYLYQQKEQTSAQKGLYGIPAASGSRSSVANSPAMAHHRHGRSPSVQPSPSAYQVPRQLQYVYQQDNGSSASFQQHQSPTVRHTMQQQQQQQQHRHAAPYSSPLQQREEEDEYVGIGQAAHRVQRHFSEEPSRSPSPVQGVKIIRSPHHQHATAHQPAYQNTPPRTGVAGMTSPMYNRGYAQGRHTSPGAGTEPAARNKRCGYWNRRGDHLTKEGYIVYCPPGRNYPSELSDYPEDAFQDHLGHILHERPDSRTEHPDSIPQFPRREPVKPYDMFIEYILVDNN